MRNALGSIISIVVFLTVFGGFGVLLYNNAQQAKPIRVIVPTEPPPTISVNSLADIFSVGFGEDSTPLPTIAIPTQRFVAPTLPNTEVANISQTNSPIELYTLAPVSQGQTPTPIPPTPTPFVGGAGETPVALIAPQSRATDVWQPPSLPVPQSNDPLGRDHYILARPVDSNARNYGLFYYPYGADGSATIGAERVHHGVDFSNPVGTPIRAAGSGIVVFASSEEQPTLPGSPAYGQVVIIEHDFGWKGEPIFTLYAHLERPLVQAGDVVEMGQVIALSGNSGRSSGPHLHFEVRYKQNLFGSTYNPALWIVPYVGHGTIAGKLIDTRGNDVEDILVTARNLTDGRVFTTQTYTFDGTVNEINADPEWDENFVIADLPVGRYEVIVSWNNQRISQVVHVFEGLTTFVELQPVQAATPQPVDSSP
ncbi:MAG: hypothetical protein Kow00117_08790 [Phototrophicales bacterium]